MVTVPAPPFPAGFGEKNYNAAVEYLESFEGLPDHFEVLSVENKFVLNIDGYAVSGIADLVVRNRETGGIMVIDHKTKSDNSMKKDLPTYTHQLYLYAMWVHECYGEWPDKLCFNMVKSGKMIEVEFDPAHVEETRAWILDGIKSIEECDLFDNWTSCIPAGTEKEPYFCRSICGCNDRCDDYIEVRNISYQRWLEKKQLEEEMMNGFS